jgi:hypothetical protein
MLSKGIQATPSDIQSCIAELDEKGFLESKGDFLVYLP